jgi:hypothetical protein
MNQTRQQKTLERKRKKAEKRKARASVKREDSDLWKRPKDGGKWARRHGWVVPDKFMTGQA